MQILVQLLGERLLRVGDVIGEEQVGDVVVGEEVEGLGGAGDLLVGDL